MKTKKLLSLLLALMMMLSVVPMYASAADPIALTEANVTVWPTANGEIYYGQKINEGITLSGGEVQCDGVVVPGHFEFVDPEQRNSKGYTDLKFVPDDTTSYSAFEIANAFNVIFTLNKTTPVFVDANNTPVATEVASAGTLLGKSKISGGQVMNPFYPEESTALGFTWSWVNRREPVTKSGYYEAKLGAGNYNTITTMIYVKIAGDVPETSIVETPTIPELNYNPDITWADVPLTGGKAVINDNEEVSGTFAISDTWKDKVPEIGSYNVSVIFTPDDLTKASVYTMLIPVIIDDVDAAIGQWGGLVQYTMNRQLLIKTLMDLADNPFSLSLYDDTESYQKYTTNRIPIILTLNDESKMYEPLMRNGRTTLFPWIPNHNEIGDILNRIFKNISFAKAPINLYDDLLSFSKEELNLQIENLPISLFTDIVSSLNDDYLWEQLCQTDSFDLVCDSFFHNIVSTQEYSYLHVLNIGKKFIRENNNFLMCNENNFSKEK